MAGRMSCVMLSLRSISADNHTVTPEDILAQPALVLCESERRQYFEDGYLVVPEFLPGECLSRLQEKTEELFEQARHLSESNEAFDLGPGHTPQAPNVRRIRAVILSPRDVAKCSRLSVSPESPQFKASQIINLAQPSTVQSG